MEKETLEIIGRILETLKQEGKVFYCTDDYGGLIRVLREEDAIFNLTFLMGCDLIEKEYDGILPHWDGKFPRGTIMCPSSRRVLGYINTPYHVSHHNLNKNYEQENHQG